MTGSAIDSPVSFRLSPLTGDIKPRLIDSARCDVTLPFVISCLIGWRRRLLVAVTTLMFALCVSQCVSSSPETVLFASVSCLPVRLTII